MARSFRLTFALVSVLSGIAYAQVEPKELPDNNAWLEDVYGKKPMEWVKSHNDASAKILQADPRFAKLQANALKVAEAPDRLPAPDLQDDGVVYNAWQDANHVRGILRRTTLKSYLTNKPNWTTVLDFDKIGKAEKMSWVNDGLVRLEPGDRLCLVGLSDGGEDAHVYREFDLKKNAFVKNGFVVPKAKSDVTWIDKDHLLVTSEWGPGTLTESGYPYISKVWKRGTPLSSATEVYRSTSKAVGVGSAALHDGQGNQVNLIYNYRTFFEAEFFLLNGEKATKLRLPEKCDVNGLIDNRLILSLRENWKPDGSDKTFRQGSVLAIDAYDLETNAKRLKPAVVFEPSKTEFAESVGLTKSRLILTTLDNVQGRAYACDYVNSKWQRKKLPVGDNLSVQIMSTTRSDDRFFVDISGFTTPGGLYLADAKKATLKAAKIRKPKFDASNLEVGQLWATSKDGTKVPYFIVHKKNFKHDGKNPTLLSAYGGFQSSSTPYYSAFIGKMWLERGGVYVLANIRGGGEFGPAWHAAGLKTKRQRIYDDFYAVGQDLVRRKITSPAHLGIEGGSNGGLLVGVAMTQHPSMWNAVVIEIPLLDMLGFEHIAAGASWVGEYGSTSVPEERRFLASISPYNQLKRDVTYPEPLLFTTTKDDRVGPVHARKFAARMEEYGKPFYYYEITEGGHGAGADLKQSAKSWATIYMYLTRKLMD